MAPAVGYGLFFCVCLSILGLVGHWGSTCRLFAGFCCLLLEWSKKSALMLDEKKIEEQKIDDGRKIIERRGGGGLFVIEDFFYSLFDGVSHRGADRFVQHALELRRIEDGMDACRHCIGVGGRGRSTWGGSILARGCLRIVFIWGVGEMGGVVGRVGRGGGGASAFVSVVG